MRKILLAIIISVSIVSFAQTPLNDHVWVLTPSYSDDFNGTLSNHWMVMSGYKNWGAQFFTINNITFDNENDKDYLRLKADMNLHQPYSGGITARGYGCGYYEIEARVIQETLHAGVWPASCAWDASVEANQNNNQQ